MQKPFPHQKQSRMHTKQFCQDRERNVYIDDEIWSQFDNFIFLAINMTILKPMPVRQPHINNIQNPRPTAKMMVF